MSHRQEQKAAAREQRMAAEREEAARAARRKRLQWLGIVGGIAAAAVVVLLVVAGGGDDAGEPGGGTAVAGASDVQARYQDIPQSGTTLGDPEAPVVVSEYADMQCPFCAQYSNEVQPQVIDEYVRTGQIRIELRLLRFIGPDSDRAARVAAYAAERDRMWHFVDVFFHNQGSEGTGYATDQFLSSIADAAGLPGDEAVEAIQQPETERLITESEQEAQQRNISSTPAFTVTDADGETHRLELQDLTFEAFQQALEPHLEPGT
jgi:protein-disulfide isomerase